MPHDFPILEFDPDRDALIDPVREIDPWGAPEPCVLTFFHDVVTRLAEEGTLRPLGEMRSEMGAHPVFVGDVDGRHFTVVPCGVGAPFAAAQLEEIIAHGSRRFVACGGAGVLDSELEVGQVVVPTAAVRDEGTSYHYAPPSREIEPDADAVEAILSVLEARGVPYRRGKTWTTDAFYRETKGKISRRREEGCLTVEMEAAALFAVARFRGVPLAALLYGGDDVSGDAWDSRGWHARRSVREAVLHLAIEVALALPGPSCREP